MNILVTGASGFIGSAFVRELSRHNIDIYCLDHIRDKSLFTDCSIKEFYKQDLTQSFKLQTNFDFVFHLGALNVTHVGREEYDAYYQVNVQGTENLIKAVCTKKLMFMSTVKVYQKQTGNINEGSTIDPKGGYERSKYEAEKVCQRYFDENDLTILRSVNIVGVGQAEKAVIPVFFKNALNGHPLKIIYSGKTNIQMLDVRDLIRAFLLLIEKNIGLGVINLCSDEVMTLRVLAENIISICQSNSLSEPSKRKKSPTCSPPVTIKISLIPALINVSNG